jgi:phage FluMu gp28-like protein
MRKQEARRWRGSEALAQRDEIRQAIIKLDKKRQEKIDATRGNTVAFLTEVCKLAPYWYQLELAELYKKNQFLAVRWPRQTGKSTLIGALLLQDAWENPNLNIAFIGPSWRQTKNNITITSRFCHNLPTQSLRLQRTRISLPNGSAIEAFPNNPDTIRGRTFHRIWWDEANFTQNDQDLYDAILFTLGTTKGKLIASSTPFNTDSIFWKMCNHEGYQFARHHFTWEKALSPQGPLDKPMVEIIKSQFGEDQSHWRREMEAEWSQDEDVWLPQGLIASCIGTVKNCGTDLQPWDPEKGYSGDLFAGLDLAQVRDFTVFSVFERQNNTLLLRHLKIFRQPTKYAHVKGYVKTLQDRWDGFQKIRVDTTREGPSFISDMEEAGIKNAEGVNFSTPRKSEIAGLLKQRMMNGKLFYPHLTMDKPYPTDLCSELNNERFELRKDGTMAFSHPSGSHDDVFWSIALAVYATVDMKQFDLDALRFG